jgi:hypothetical protein
MTWTHEQQIKSQRRYRAKNKEKIKAYDAEKHLKKMRAIYGDDYVVGQEGNRRKIKEAKTPKKPVVQSRIFVHRIL